MSNTPPPFSFTAIKIGRYTIGHKTNNIKEVKSLELQEKVKEQLVTPQEAGAMDNLIESLLAQFVTASPESLSTGQLQFL